MFGSHFLLHIVAFCGSKERIGCSQCDCNGFHVRVTCGDVGDLHWKCDQGCLCVTYPLPHFSAWLAR